MIAHGTFRDIDTTTLESLKSSYTQCVQALATSQSYSIGDKTLTRIDLPTVLETLREISAELRRRADVLSGKTERVGRVFYADFSGAEGGGSPSSSPIEIPESAVSALSDLSDVVITSVQVGQVLKWDGSKWVNADDESASGAGPGDVVGPASSTAGNLALFPGTTGKIIADSGQSLSGLVSSISGKEGSGVAATLDAAHVAAGDPHPQYTTISEASAAAPVQSVAAKTGVVTLVKADVGLGSVDNTADTAKPVSTAQQAALNLKADLASPALTGSPTAPTASADDNTTKLATTAFVQQEITNDTTKAATGHTHSNATTSAAGFESAADKTKLDGIATGATANDTDANLKARANHTGTQLAATVSDLPAAVDARIAAASIDALLDVFVSSPLVGQVLKWNGSAWVNDTDSTGGGGGAGTKTIAVFFPRNNEPPSSNYATELYRNNHPTLAFDTTTQEVAIFRGIIPEAASLTSGLTVFIQWSATSATSGTIGWDVSFERIVDSGQDTDSDNFGTAQTVTAATVSGTSGITIKTSVNFSQAQLPTSLAAGDMYRIRIRRDVANDTATGDAELHMVEVRLQ